MHVLRAATKTNPSEMDIDKANYESIIIFLFSLKLG